MEKLQINRNYSLDVARIVAALAVVLTHCCGSFVTNYQPLTYEFMIANFFDSISRFGVPIFLMISGSLFLDERKEVTLKSVFAKNIKTLAVITVVWSIMFSLTYTVILPLIRKEPINVSYIAPRIVNGHFHMWYLYLIMELYIVVPFLKKIVSKENKNMVVFFIVFSFLMHFLLPQISMIFVKFFNIEYISMFIDNFDLGFFGTYTTYLLVGWYIVHIGITHKYIKKLVHFMGFLSVAFVILYVHFTGDYENGYNNIGAPVFIFSISVFLVLNSIKLSPNSKNTRWLVGLSKLTFGVYLIHPLLLTIYKDIIAYKENLIAYIIVEFAVVVCASFLLSYLISKIPVMNKLIKS